MPRSSHPSEWQPSLSVLKFGPYVVGKFVEWERRFVPGSGREPPQGAPPPAGPAQHFECSLQDPTEINAGRGTCGDDLGIGLFGERNEEMLGGHELFVAVGPPFGRVPDHPKRCAGFSFAG